MQISLTAFFIDFPWNPQLYPPPYFYDLRSKHNVYYVWERIKKKQQVGTESYHIVLRLNSQANFQVILWKILLQGGEKYNMYLFYYTNSSELLN